MASAATKAGPDICQPMVDRFRRTFVSGFGGTSDGFKDQRGFIPSPGILVFTLHVFYGAIAFWLCCEPVSSVPVLTHEIGERITCGRTYVYSKKLKSVIGSIHACLSL